MRWSFLLLFWSIWFGQIFLSADDNERHRQFMIRMLPVMLTNIPLFFVNTEVLIPKVLRKSGIGPYLLSVLALILTFVVLEGLLKNWRIDDYSANIGLHTSKSFFFIIFITAISTGYGLVTHLVGEEQVRQDRQRERMKAGSQIIQPMLMIPFVENSFKHGVGLVDQPSIDIQVQFDARELHFTVHNRIASDTSADKDSSSSIGLRNVRRRLDAVESYELNVVDYLLKPVSMERFTKATLKAWELQQKRPVAPETPALPEVAKAADFFFVNVEYALVKIPIPDITYIEGMKDYVKIYLSTARKPVLTKSTLKAVEEKLPPQNFMRVHKSFIVHVDKIESIRNRQIREAYALMENMNLESKQYIEEQTATYINPYNIATLRSMTQADSLIKLSLDQALPMEELRKYLPAMVDSNSWEAKEIEQNLPANPPHLSRSGRFLLVQNDSLRKRLVLGMLANYLARKVGYSEPSFDPFTPAFSPTNLCSTAGELAEIAVFLKSNTPRCKLLSLHVNGESLAIKDEVAHFKHSYTTRGIYPLEVKALTSHINAKGEPLGPVKKTFFLHVNR